MNKESIINESFFKLFEEDNNLNEGAWELFKRYLRGDKDYMKKVSNINKDMSKLEKMLQSELDHVSKKTGKKYKKIKLHRFEPEDFIETAK